MSDPTKSFRAGAAGVPGLQRLIRNLRTGEDVKIARNLGIEPVVVDRNRSAGPEPLATDRNSGIPDPRAAPHRGGG